jgi:NACHT domain- and WD repeat-containing protein
MFISQVLVGHSDAVLTVGVSVTNKSQVISGSKDCNLIVWDLHTGEEIHTLAGHLGPVTCVKVSADGKNIFRFVFVGVLKGMTAF